MAAFFWVSGEASSVSVFLDVSMSSVASSTKLVFFFLFPPTGLFLTLPYNFTTRGTLYSFLLTYAELRGIHESKRQHQVERRGVKGRSEATGRRLFFVTKAKDLISSCHLMDGELKELDAYALPFYRTNTTTRA